MRRICPAGDLMLVKWMIALICFAIPGTAWCQAVGAISGTVKDPSGAVVPDANVSALRVETGIAQKVRTNEQGLFTFPNLFVGTYRLTIEAPGFATQTVAGITLDVSQHRDVQVALAMADSSSQVEVTSAPPLIDTTSGQVAGLVTQQQVENLPLNGQDGAAWRLCHLH